MKITSLIHDFVEGLLVLFAVMGIAATLFVWVPYLAEHVR